MPDGEAQEPGLRADHRLHAWLRRPPPCLCLADLPTPVEPAPWIDPSAEVWVKRDDHSSDLYGGGKVRKFEWLLASAPFAGDGPVLSVGGIGSNHLVSLALFLRRFGRPLHALTFEQVVTPHVRDNLATIASLGLEEDTLVVITSDHGETLYDHECWYDHHGLYECTLEVPLCFVWPGKVPAGVRVKDYTLQKDTTPTILDLMGIRTGIKFDGRSLKPRMEGKPWVGESEFYITEATWMRKHGWRTPEWKLIQALEPDFHFKPEIELYNLVKDPEENTNVADREPAVVKLLQSRMLEHIARREKQTGRTNPMYTNLKWHGFPHGPFTSSQQAYDEMHIGSPNAAQKLQARELRRQRGQKKL